MKSYKNLSKKMLNGENIEKCIWNASLGKRNRSDVKWVLEHIDEVVLQIQESVTDGSYYEKLPHHVPFLINDGVSRKKRWIIKPNFNEQIVHHMLVSVSKDIIMQGMYELSCGSIPGRGGIYAKERVEKYIKKHQKDNKINYCLKLDVKHFFQSVSHTKLKKLISKHIKDQLVCDVYFAIIDAYEDHHDEVTGERYGIPIGFYTSQWLANWYLQGLDHYIKEDLKAGFYARYMDDMVIFGETSKELHEMKEKIEEYLNNVCDLELNKKWQVFKFDSRKSKSKKGRCLDFVGFRFFRDRTILRKNLMLKGTRKARKIFKQRDCNWYEATQLLSSLGWFHKSDTKYCFKKYIKPYVYVNSLKHKVSKHKRKLNQEKIIDLNKVLEERRKVA